MKKLTLLFTVATLSFSGTVMADKTFKVDPSATNKYFQHTENCGEPLYENVVAALDSMPSTETLTAGLTPYYHWSFDGGSFIKESAQIDSVSLTAPIAYSWSFE